MKSQRINNEEWPPYHKDAPVEMDFPNNLSEHKRFALGHQFFGLISGLFMYHSLWLREHNRVCSVLASEHPEWEDEQLFQTAKLILQGRTYTTTAFYSLFNAIKYSFITVLHLSLEQERI